MTEGRLITPVSRDYNKRISYSLGRKSDQIINSEYDHLEATAFDYPTTKQTNKLSSVSSLDF